MLQAMYDKLKVSFLQDPNDSVAAYEERGKGKCKRSRYDQGMEALSNMDRVQQGEMMHGETIFLLIKICFIYQNEQ